MNNPLRGFASAKYIVNHYVLCPHCELRQAFRITTLPSAHIYGNLQCGGCNKLLPESHPYYQQIAPKAKA